MRHQLPGSLLLLSCLAACQLAPGVPIRREAVAASPAVAASTPVASSSVAPAAPSSPRPTASAASALKLLGKPATAFRMLAGTLQMDARYAVDASAGKLIADNGGGVLGNNGSSVIANNAGNVISNNSSGVLVVGSGIISDAGALMLSKGNLISDAGALAVAPGSKHYSLQATDTKVPIGTVVPAAGMALRAVDLATGKSIALGVAADGSPVYEILTNASGQYEIYLPKDAADNVLVTARVPGNDDARLQYGLFSSKARANGAIDEDTDKATHYIRQVYAREWAQRLRGQYDDEGPGGGFALIGAGGPGDQGNPHRAFDAVADAALAAGVNHLSDDAINALALRISDLVLTRLDPTTAHIVTKLGGFSYDGPDETIFDAYVGVMQQGREAVTKKMREVEASGQDPLAYFNHKSYLVDANKGLATPYVVKKPIDVVDFMCSYYMGNTSAAMAAGVGPAGAIAVAGDIDLPFDVFIRFMAATLGMLEAQNVALYQDNPPLIDQVLDVVKQAGAGAASATPSSP